MIISDGCIASFHYTLTNNDGQTLDSSESEGPLVYLHGAANIVPGLEKELAGKKVGDTLTVTVPSAEAYGPRDDNMLEEMSASMFSGVEKIEVGMEFHAETENGLQVVSVAAVDGDKVTIDGNHPLAGVDLTFDVEITGIREATEEEKTHGHAHGEGGYEH